MPRNGSRADRGAAQRRSRTIIHHPDVRRMLLTMKSQIEAMRAFGYGCRPTSISRTSTRTPRNAIATRRGSTC